LALYPIFPEFQIIAESDSLEILAARPLVSHTMQGISDLTRIPRNSILPTIQKLMNMGFLRLAEFRTSKREGRGYFYVSKIEAIHICLDHRKQEVRIVSK